MSSFSEESRVKLPDSDQTDSGLSGQDVFVAQRFRFKNIKCKLTEKCHSFSL